MPTYRYCCPEGHHTLEWRSIHAKTIREIPCETCAGIAVLHMASPAIAADALPNKRHEVRAANAREKRWEEDMPAYKRLRDDGLQPRSVDGARLVEQCATDPLEVQIGRPLGEHLSEAKDAYSQLAQNDPAQKGAEIGEARRAGRPLPV